jgi:predicted RNA binding protein with dsRBD fold (UPF0201 family)
MRSKGLTATLSHLQRLLADPRLEDAHREKLRKGHRELKKARQSGRLDQRKVFSAVSMISETLLEMLTDADSPTAPESPGRNTGSK